MLVEVGLASSAGTEFDDVIVPFDEGNHAEQHDISGPLRELLWLKADAGVTADESGYISNWADQSGNSNGKIDGADFTEWLKCGSGPGIPADPTCDN